MKKECYLKKEAGFIPMPIKGNVSGDRQGDNTWYNTALVGGDLDC